MQNITYLLGAGASCGIRVKEENKGQKEKDVVRNVALPLVYEIPERIRNVSNFLMEIMFTFEESTVYAGNNFFLDEDIQAIYKKYGFNIPDKGQGYYFNEDIKLLYNEFLNFADQIENHASIDTLAKKFYFTQEKVEGSNLNYERIKQLIDLFFTIEHFLSEFDLRYDAFLASVLQQNKDKSIYLRKELNILSWNYDYQFEYSLAKFYQINQLDIIRKRFYILPLDEVTLVDENKKFTLFRLNGSAGGFYRDSTFYSDKIAFNSFLNLKEAERNTFKEITNGKKTEQKVRGFIKSLLAKNLLYLKGEILAPIKFAWEQQINKLMEFDNPTSLLDTIQRTEVLVIIGYSFPTFNRETDKAILDNLELIQKIYLQVPSIETFEEIQTKIKSLGGERLRHIEIEYIKAGNEFFVPFEFN